MKTSGVVLACNDAICARSDAVRHSAHAIVLAGPRPARPTRAKPNQKRVIDVPKFNAMFPNQPVGPLFARAQMTLGLTHEKLGEALGVSKRTVARWSSRGPSLSIHNLHTLARLVHPRDASLAEQLAGAGSETLESLGIVAPPPPPAPAPPPPPLPLASVVEAVVCAAADALNVPPATVRAALFAAFGRARELRLSVEQVEGALAPREPVRSTPSKASAKT